MAGYLIIRLEYSSRMELFHLRLFSRIMAKSREVYLLKIISLGVAFAASTLVGLFGLNEFGYDRFRDGHASIFRLLQRNNAETHSGNRLSNRIPPEVISDLRSQSGDSMVLSRVKLMSELSIVSGHSIFDDQDVHAADPEITRIFPFDIVDGSPDNFDAKKQVVIISSSMAQRFFGSRNAAGEKIKIVALGDTLLFTIAAVYADFPANTHEEFNIFIAFNNSSIQTLHFNPEDTGVYGKALSPYSPFHDRVVSTGAEDVIYRFQPIAEIYFGPAVIGENVRHGDRYSIIIIICITGLIFFLALTSFVNLTTLTLPNRAKELAVKKLAGTSQWNLMTAFAKESFAIVGIALITGLLLLLLTSPLTEPILSIDIISLMSRGDFVMMLIFSGLFLILAIAPLFMAVEFTKAAPSRLLSTSVITFPRFKRIIIILQLGISIFLIVASMVIKRQIDYSLLKEPGRNHDQIVYTRCPPDITSEGLRSLRSGWQKYNPNILDVIATSQLPNQINSKEITSEFYVMSVDPGFRDFFDVKMVEGNWFKPNAGDSIVVINGKGQKLSGDKPPNVIGVFKDMSGQFNQPEKPIKINIAPRFNYNFLCIRVLEVDIRRTVNYLARTFETDQKSASISFLNKRFEEWLHYQDKLNRMSGMLALISVVLSCLAIYGLSISIVRDKLKPIAVHKLCGAGTLNITRLLVREFTGQMFLAILIFGPLTYLILKELLRTFVYSTHFIWSDPLIPLAYCGIVIVMLCAFQAWTLNREDLSAALKG